MPGSNSDGSDDAFQPLNQASVPPMQPPAETALPSLFWDTLPENVEENPDWAALQALREESTPKERAESFKVQGNNKLKVGLQAKNKVLLREAVDFYGRGLAEKCGDAHLDAVLFSNRAHVHSLLGNWRSALDDAQAAQILDSSNIKAFFRGARAALRLGQHELCRQQCQAGRAVGGAVAPEFDELEKEAITAMVAAQAAADRQRLEDERRLAPVRALARAITERRYQITLPQVRLQHRQRPTLDLTTRRLTWPVVILYPEGGTQDEVEAWDEQDTVHDQLDQMFGPEAPPLAWDIEHMYRRDTVELYYLSWAGEPLSEEQLPTALDTGQWPGEVDGKAAVSTTAAGAAARLKEQRWVRVKEAWSLHDLLSQPDFVVPGVPLLAAVARGSPYRQRFLARNKA